MVRRWGNQYGLGEEISRFLPTDAFNKGFRLRWEETRPWVGRGDPVILTKAPQGEVYRWEYIPTMGEVWDKIRELESK